MKYLLPVFFLLFYQSIAQRPIEAYTLLRCKNTRCFILFDKNADTVDYEAQLVDKPTYFKYYDTLIKRYDGIFVGKQMVLLTDSIGYTLHYKDEEHSRSRNREFEIANQEQIAEWHYLKNIDNFRKLNYDSAYGNAARSAVDSLLQMTRTLNQTEFNKALNAIVDKYSTT